MNDLINTGFSKVNSADASSAKAYLSNANDTIKNAGQYKIEVLNGVHAGSVHIQKSGTITIGKSEENDIILFGSNIAPQHFELTLKSGVFSQLQVTPLDEIVTLEDGAIVEVGQYANISSDEEIHFGDVIISITRIADPKSFIKPGIRILALLCVLAMIPIGYNVAAGFLGTVAEAGSRVASTVQHGIEQTSSRLLNSVTPSTETRHDKAFAWTVRVKLEDLKLNHKLRVDPTSDGSIRVHGNITDKELPRWTSFLQWYDTTTNFPPLIRDVSRAQLGSNLPQIKSVWLDDNPSVFFKDGAVGNLGSKIKGGWKIVNITDMGVMIERDGAIISLTY